MAECEPVSAAELAFASSSVPLTAFMILALTDGLKIVSAWLDRLSSDVWRCQPPGGERSVVSAVGSSGSAISSKASDALM